MSEMYILPIELAHIVPKAKSFEDAKQQRDVTERALVMFNKGNYWARVIKDEEGKPTGVFEVGKEWEGEEKTAYAGGPYLVNIVDNTCTCPYQTGVNKHPFCKHSIGIQIWWNFHAKEVRSDGIVVWSLS